MNNTQIDDSQITRLFESLSVENRNKALTKAFKVGAKKLADDTKQQLRAKLGAGATSGKKYGKSLESGIKVKADAAYSEVSVHIMGDFRLKFFEKGTKERTTKGRKIVGYSGRNLRRSGKGGGRGKITALNFFRTARQNESQLNEIIKRSITESLQKL